MRALVNTPDQLLLSDQSLGAPIFFGVLAILFTLMAWFARTNAPGISLGMLLIVALLVLGVVASLGHSTADFSRSAGQVTIRTSGPFGRPAETIRLGVIREAYAHFGGKGTTGSGLPSRGGYRPSLLLRTAERSLPLSLSHGKRSSADETVRIVNEWLGVKETSR
jgi:hypothetical protein